MIIPSTGKIAERLYAIGNPVLPAYLLTGEIPVLFDAGISFMGPTYLKDLHQNLGDAGRLRTLFLTHAHFDHCGSAPYLKRKIPHLKIAASRLAGEVFKRPSAVELIRTLNREMEQKFQSFVGDEDVSFEPLEVDLVLEEGPEVVLGNGERVQVIATPGHTRDAVCYYLPRLKALITGEAVGVYDREMKIQAEFLASYDDYLASLEKLRRLPMEIILMGHGYVLTGQEARGYIEKSMAETGEFRKRIEADLQRLGKKQGEVVQKIFQEDYVERKASLQEPKPYLLNLTAKVRCIAEEK